MRPDFAGGCEIRQVNPTRPRFFQENMGDGKLCMKFHYERFIQRFIQSDCWR